MIYKLSLNIYLKIQTAITDNRHFARKEENRRKIVTFQEKELKNGVASFRNILKDRTNYYNGNGVKVTKVSEDTEVANITVGVLPSTSSMPYSLMPHL